MDIEAFRAYCLSFAGAHDAFPFGKATSEYDRDLLVFYVADKWFCFVNAVAFDFCNVRCAPERIAGLQERYEGIGPGWHMNKKHWISVRFDRDVPEALLRELVRDSYETAAGLLTRKQRAELAVQEAEAGARQAGASAPKAGLSAQRTGVSAEAKKSSK